MGNIFFEQLSNELSDVYGSPHIAKKPVYLVKKILKSLKEIKHIYRNCIESQKTGSVYEWLCDNYYIVEREAKTALRDIRNSRKIPCDTGSIPLLYRELETAYKKPTNELSTETLNELIEAIQKKRELSTDELEMLLPCIKSVFISNVCDSLTEPVFDTALSLISSSIKSLRSIQNIDFAEIISKNSIIEQIYAEDPCKVFAKMDEKSRLSYRKTTAQIARHIGQSEREVASQILRLAQEGLTERTRHVGYYIFKHPTITKEKTIKANRFLRWQGLIFIASFVLFSILLRNPFIAFIISILIHNAIKPIIETRILKNVSISHLPRIRITDIPNEEKTLIVISTLLQSNSNANDFKEHLKHTIATAPNDNVYVVILADPPQSKSKQRDDDNERIASTKAIIKELNAEFEDRFILVVRQRSFCKTQNSFCGYERKRGAISDLIKIIKGEKIDLLATEGDINRLYNAKHIIALDSDTKMLIDSVRDLVATAMHPLNRPFIDPSKNIVTDGYGILTPKISTDLSSSIKTPFSRAMAGCGGVTAYDNNARDVYQDLFDDAIFSGKGLINVDAFYQVMHNRIPDETVLSHDILEGCYLRTGFVADVEMSDKAPTSMSSWFSRLHRWIRGDWQNIIWLSRNVPAYNTTVENVISHVNKFKLFDNLRRSLMPLIITVALFVSLLTDKRVAAMLGVFSLISIILPYLYSIFRETVFEGFFALLRKYYSRALPTALGNATQALYVLITTVYSALVTLDAITKSLFRIFISKKNLLQWTTAAEGEGKKTSAVEIIRLIVSTLFGMVLLLISPIASIRIMGLLFAFVIPLFFLSKRESRKMSLKISSRSREILTDHAKAMWQFYCDYFNEENNFLPPDNIQEAPTACVAYRTSPTNIGFLMISTLAAYDMGFIDADTLLSRLNLTLDTVDRLEKYHGNLYNWYDTKTLEVLRPKYVSSVDSGNYICMLLTLKNGLLHIDSCDGKRDTIIDRLNKIISQTKIEKLYNTRRKLFSIGYDAEKGELSHSYYDLLMSEARMTSYYAVASRRVPKKHWESLGRSMVTMGCYAGPVSWTGTMFEYFMPFLFLPAKEGSLTFEALRFCIHCQKGAVKSKKVPYGYSESAYYAFDPSLNYQYKAHGAARLGLKRGLESDNVVSPYSTYLTLPFDPYHALNNLQLLEKEGAYGRYGMYEAIDYTHSRVGNAKKAIIRSYMAHHVGMSLISICNALNDGIMQKRFMSDNKMMGANELLEEKIENGTVMLSSIQRKDPPERAVRLPDTPDEYDVITPEDPRIQILSNGEIHSYITDAGNEFIRYRNIDVLRFTKDLLSGGLGIFSIIKSGNDVFSVTKAPLYSNNGYHRCEFTDRYVAHYVKHKHIEAGVMTTVDERQSCEIKKVLIKNNKSRKDTIELAFYLEPCLAQYKEDKAHPAFSKLRIKSEFDKENQAFIYSREVNDKKNKIFLAVALKEQFPFEAETLRENILRRPLGISSLNEVFDKPFGNTVGAPDPVCAIKLRLDLPSKSESTVSLIISVATSRQEAIDTVISARKSSVSPEETSSPTVLHGDEIEKRLAFSALPSLLYNRKDCHQIISARSANVLSKKNLWSLSISGDNPIIFVMLSNEIDTVRIEGYVKMQRLLKLHGIQTDLIIGYREGGNYAMPVLSSIKDIVCRLGAESSLGQSGGIFTIDFARYPDEYFTLVSAAASHIAPRSMVRLNIPYPEYRKQHVIECQPIYARGGTPVYCGDFYNDHFTVHGDHQRPLCTILANRSFGTLISDKALGYSFALNSRENKLTPWYNDTCTDNVGERLLLKIGDKVYDMINGSCATFYTDKAVYKGKAENIRFEITVSVPERDMKKTYRIRFSGEGKAQCAFYTEPTLDVNRDTAAFITFEPIDDGIVLKNAYSSEIKGYMALRTDRKISNIVCDRSAFLCGKWDDESSLPLPEPCAALIIDVSVTPQNSHNAVFSLIYSHTRKYIDRISVNEGTAAIALNNRIVVNTPDKFLNYLINCWLPWQTLGGRYLARTGFYQCGGAWGFRDQLQDCLSIMLLSPKKAKQHIYRCCHAQFPEGDVLHWWHTIPCTPSVIIKGVRTRYSDDLLWLPYVLCEYIEKTADYEILDKKIRYREAPLLSDHDHELYCETSLSDIKESVFSHCKRAITKAIKRGENGLMLIGGGDWNDGFNKIGINGAGESVWLTMFAAMVLESFSKICEHMGQSDESQKMTDLAKELKESIDAHCFEEDRYTRAIFDNGYVLGSSDSTECSIDSLSQSFSILCNMPDEFRKRVSLESAYNILVDKQNKIIKLFDPPFEGNGPDPGYISRYPAGIRENGGQYTHAAVWLALAFLKSGDADKGYELIRMINPANHCISKTDFERFGGEPYYIPADVSSGDNVGRSGWSIYTGAASWYYKTVIESMLGIIISGNKIIFNPNIPISWNGFDADISINDTKILLKVVRDTKHETSASVYLDGKKHEITVCAK